MQLFVFAFGKLKTPGLREAADYYKKLSSSWTPIQEVELKPLSVPDKSAATRIRIQEKEGQHLLERIESSTSGRQFIFLLDETGKSQKSEVWAHQWQNWENSGVQSISFCVGSSLGFSPEVRQKALGSFNLGQQTLSHELARVVLFEQLYRAQSILKGHPYHNSGS